MTTPKLPLEQVQCVLDNKSAGRRCNAPGHGPRSTTSMSTTDPIPDGFCQCGCGARTPLAKRTRRDLGYVKGRPVGFLRGHNARRSVDDYEIVDTGASSACWLWLRNINATGYGMVQRDGKARSAHRWFYEQANGPIGTGLTLDHLCRQRRCVNPDHLEPVPLRENIWRGWEARYGDEGHNAVRTERLARRMSQREFAALLGIAQTTLSAWERGVLPLPTDWSSRLRLDEREVVGGETYGRRATA